MVEVNTQTTECPKELFPLHFKKTYPKGICVAPGYFLQYIAERVEFALPSVINHRGRDWNLFFPNIRLIHNTRLVGGKVT